MLYRKFYDELVKWHKQEKKLALLIDGARQIGKTTIIRQFAKDYYGDNFVEINFINTPSAKEIFAGDISVDGIISKLTLFLRRPLTPHKTLIFFDEVHDYPIYISDRIILSHRPHVEMDTSVLNISGHLHGSTLNLPNYMCASLHVNDYKPITNQQVQGKLGSLPKRDIRFLWEWFAPYYRFTQKKEDCIYDKDGNIDLAASRVMQRLNQGPHNKSGESE